MKSLQTSIVVEESWVEKQTEKLQSLPTATSARELDVSTKLYFLYFYLFDLNSEDFLNFKHVNFNVEKIFIRAYLFYSLPSQKFKYTLFINML
jgi:hypothetical protein